MDKIASTPARDPSFSLALRATISQRVTVLKVYLLIYSAPTSSGLAYDVFGASNDGGATAGGARRPPLVHPK